MNHGKLSGGKLLLILLFLKADMVMNNEYIKKML